MQAIDWTQDGMLAVEQGIKDWKENESGVQIAATAAEPWLDSEHRRYRFAKVDGKVCVCQVFAFSAIQLLTRAA